jgi:hypothetical protein
MLELFFERPVKEMALCSIKKPRGNLPYWQIAVTPHIIDNLNIAR